MVLMVDGDDDNRGTAVLTAIAGCRASDGIRYLRSGAAIVRGYLYFLLDTSNVDLSCSNLDVDVVIDSGWMSQ